MRAILLAAIAIAASLAGCVAPASGLSLQDAAAQEATKTYPDAVLVGVLGAEWTNDSFVTEITAESPEAASLAEQGVDLNPGDGLANAWAYFFHADEGDMVVVVGADGSIIETELLGDSGDRSQTFGFTVPIGDVAIDSVEASTIVHENHGRFTEVVASDDVLVMMFLVRDDDYFDGAFWAFMAFTDLEAEEDFLLALVNAEDGTYTDFSQFFGG